MADNGQNKPDWSSKTSDGSMDTRSTTPDNAAEKVRKHSERAAEGGKTGGADAEAAKVSPEAAGAMRDQVGKGG